jgi:hypothetical protein
MSESFHVNELFWLSGSQGKNFSMTSTDFCIFVIILPFEEKLSLALYLYNSKFPLPNPDLYQV